MEENKLSADDIQEISIMADSLKEMKGNITPIEDFDELSNLMQTSDDDILVEPRITEFHDLDQILEKKDSGTNKTPSLAKYKKNRKNKQKQVNKSRKLNR